MKTTAIYLFFVLLFWLFMLGQLNTSLHRISDVVANHQQIIERVQQ